MATSEVTNQILLLLKDKEEITNDDLKFSPSEIHASVLALYAKGMIEYTIK